MAHDFFSAFSRAETIEPNKPFMVVGHETLTYGALFDRIARLTTIFLQAGLKQGDRVIIATTDDIEAVVLHFALLRNAMATVMLDPQSPALAAQTLIAVADARGILLDRKIRQKWQMGNELFVMEIVKTQGRGALLFNKLLRKKSAEQAPTDSYPALLRDTAPGSPPEDLAGEPDALILFTSGTTSQPKGVRLSQANIAHHLGTLTRQYDYSEEARILNVLPLHHTDGLTQGPMISFWNGATVYRPMPFTIQNIGHLLDCIYTERITHFVAVPTILSLILKFGQEFQDAFKTEDFRFIVSAAAALEGTLWRSFESFFDTRIGNLYGLTETVTGGLFSGPTDADHCYGTVGKPSDCSARIVNEAGCEAGPGQAGELLLKGENIMCGYLNAPEATAEVLKEGWLHTGDIATCDSDGFYRIVGRKKNVIISGGLNVHPEEVTETLNKHPEVIESCTFGVEDGTWGERVASAVVLDGSSSLQGRDLIEYCRERLAPAKVPHQIHIIPYLPKGPSGKTILAETKELALQQASSMQNNGSGDIKSRIVAIAAHCFNATNDELKHTSTPETTPGWDSLAHLHFIVELEEAFHIRFAPHEIICVTSLQEAESLILDKQGL